MTDKPLAGKVAIVSGAGGGLGRAMTLALVQAGARIAAVDANPDLAGRIARDARKAAGEDCVLPVARDLRDPRNCAAIVEEALSAFGSIHAVVNNAGIGMATIRENFWADNVKFWDVPTDKWQAVFDINVKPPFMLAKAAAPHMLARSWGRIVNVTTSLDTMIRPAWTPYGPSKAALEASSANWAGDLEGTGVTVNVLIPGGPADTPFVPLASQPDRSLLVRPEKMAAPILWLLSDASDGVNGRRFVADDWTGVISVLDSQLLPVFGSRPLDRITLARIGRWFDEFSRTARQRQSRARPSPPDHELRHRLRPITPPAETRSRGGGTRQKEGPEIRDFRASLTGRLHVWETQGPKTLSGKVYAPELVGDATMETAKPPSAVAPTDA